ncbi:MAG: hypothetical protein O3A87_03640 [Verrucomicrobia bacterium]|nr:hypothetical protein [Verrucomicrobiota bacterium]MDA1005556.1 hypothetical protein [Verrucomicrobiota bacterium]
MAGAAADWALGTRHEASRSFAARLDRIEKWPTTDLARFAKEASYIEGINAKTYIAWVAHMLLEFELNPQPQPRSREEREEIQELKKEVNEYAAEHASNQHIQRATSWLADYNKTKQLRRGDALDGRLASFYRLMRADLEFKERDLSAQFSWYHNNQYRTALAWRGEGLRIMAAKGDRVGQ